MIRKNRVGASKVDISSEWRHCVLSRDFEFPLFTFWYAWLGRTPDFWATPTSAPLSLRASHRQQMDSSDVIRHGSRWSSRDSFWLESGQAKWIYRVSDVIENYHVTGIFIFIHSLICKAWKDPRSWANAHYDAHLPGNIQTRNSSPSWRLVKGFL